MTGLIDGFVYLMQDSVFGSTLLFAIVFLFFITILLFICGCNYEQIFIFLLIPCYYFNGYLLTGIAGISIFGVVILINSLILFRKINGLLGV